jgi:hypothetical protein
MGGYITVRENVVDGAGVWLTVNTLDDYRPLRASTDNKQSATGTPKARSPDRGIDITTTY